MSLITIKKSHQELELQVLRNRLEAAGIPCYMKNEFSAQVFSNIPSFISELQVSSEDVEKAIEIMKEMDS